MKYEKRFEFYEKLYFNERELREKIEGRYRTPLTLFAVLFAFIGFMAKELFSENALSFGYGVWLPFTLSVLSFLLAAFHLSRSLYGYHYQLMPTPDVLEQYREEIKAKYRKIDPQYAIEWTNGAFEDYLFTMYIEYTTQNTKNNDTKSLNLSRCVRSLIATFLLVGLAYVPYFYQIYIKGP